MRRAPDPVAFFSALELKPYAYDFYEALRRIECLFPAQPRIGQAPRPQDEPVRFGQEPALDFAPAPISAFKPATSKRPPRLEVRFFGLLGPNGALPLHLTDFARERIRHGGDETFARFLDIFNHRFLSLFYRAWAQAQPTVGLDRPALDPFARYVGALCGLGLERVRHADALPDAAKLFHAGLLVRNVRNREGLEQFLGSFFRVPAKVEEFVGHWMPLPAGERTRLGAGDASAQLGVGVVIGAAVWDRQHKIRIQLGPLNLARYESFLPGGRAIGRLVAWLRQYLCFELDWDLRLILQRAEVPRLRLGGYGRLGWTTWLGHYSSAGDADALTLDCEASLARSEAPAPAPHRDAAYA
jgi:type VI secretion system protein ImpH